MKKELPKFGDGVACGSASLSEGSAWKCIISTLPSRDDFPRGQPLNGAKQNKRLRLFGHRDIRRRNPHRRQAERLCRRSSAPE
jgi:hypothetical protein